MADFRMVTASEIREGRGRRERVIYRLLCVSSHDTLQDAAGALDVALAGNTDLVALGAVLSVSRRCFWSLHAAENGWGALPFDRVFNAAEMAAYEAAIACPATVRA